MDSIDELKAQLKVVTHQRDMARREVRELRRRNLQLMDDCDAAKRRLHAPLHRGFA